VTVGAARPLVKEPLEEQVDAAALALHKLQVVEDASDPIVPAAARVQNIARRDADWQSPGVHDLEPVGVQVQEDVAALRVGPVDEGVDEQLANDGLLERGHLRTEHAVGQLVALAKVWDLVPDRVDELHGRELVVVPAPLRDFGPALVVLDGLHDGRAAELRAVDCVAEKEHAEVRENATAGEAVVVEQLAVGLLFDGRLHAVGTTDASAELRELRVVDARSRDAE
jgi:hypothetical protein